MLKSGIEDLKKSATVVKPGTQTTKKPMQKQNKFKKKKTAHAASPAVKGKKNAVKGKKNKKTAAPKVKQENGDDGTTDINLNGSGIPKPGPDDHPAYYKKLNLADQKGRTIVVSNFNPETTQREFHRFFSKYGKVR